MSGSRQASGSSTPTAGPSGVQQNTLDPYRTLSNALQKPLAPFLPSSSTGKNDHSSLTTLFNLDDQVVTARLSGKNLSLSSDNVTPSGPSSLVQGKKRNRGDPAARKLARDAAKRKEDHLETKGLSGLRKVKKRLGGVIKTGDRLSYDALLPLHYLHVLYLCSLLNLPPLPTPLPTTTTLPHGITMDGLSSKIAKADFTGLIISVIAARNPSLAGIEGIVIEETASTYRLVSKDDKVRVIPKNGTQFNIGFPAYSPRSTKSAAYKNEAQAQGSYGGGDADGSSDWDVGPDVARHLEVSPRIEIMLLGTNFGYRSGERAGRKFRLAQGGGGGNGWGEEWVKGEWDEVFNLLQSHDDRNTNGKRKHNVAPDGERGAGGEGMRKRGKSRRKDPLAGGSREVVFD